MKKILPIAIALGLFLGHRAGSGIVQMQARPVPQVWLKTNPTNTVTVYALATETGLRLTTEDNQYEITR